MKKVYTLFVALIITGSLMAQIPQSFKYQAVARDVRGNIVADQAVGMQISILQGSISGTAVYVETFTPTTNGFGLINLNIGEGTLVSGDFKTIEWSSDTYFLKVEMDITGGTTYEEYGTSQLLSVPYALHAATKAYVDALIEQIYAQGALRVRDYDGNYYNTIKIGNQIWMDENLKTTKYNDGTAIPLVTGITAWANLTTPGYCWYNNDEVAYGNTYGALYNWYMVETGDLCPTGWHVPSDAEWTELTDYLSGTSVAGGKLKVTGTTHWSSPNTGATNESSFTALPGGFRYNDGSSHQFGYHGYWWSSTETNATGAWCRRLYYSKASILRDLNNKKSGYSVRCVRD